MWRKIYFLSLLVIFFVINPVLATDNNLVDKQATAVATNLELYGGLPVEITVDPINGQYVYVVTYTPNGLFTSNDAAITWSGLSNEVDYGAGKAVVVDPATGNVYAAVGDDLLKSIDHGQNWTAITDNLSGYTSFVGSELAWSSNHLFVAVDYGAVQVSADGGETFTTATLEYGTRQEAISLAGDNNGTVYAILMNNEDDSTKVFRSTDNGVNWSELDVITGGVAAGSEFYSIAVDPLNYNHLVLTAYTPNSDNYQSFDGGATWTTLSCGGDINVGGREAVFNGVGGLYFGSYYTSDASAVNPTWIQLNSRTSLATIRSDIYAVDLSNPNNIYTNTSFGVAKSANGGASWSDSVQGITAVKTYAIAQANNKDIVWIGANGGLAKTTNFTGDHPTWQYPISPTDSSSIIYAVWIKPTNSDYVVTGPNNSIYYTADGGDNWIQASTPEFNGIVQTIIQSPNDKNILYAMIADMSFSTDESNGGVLISTDVGQTWSDLNFPVTLADGDLAAANVDGADVLYVGIGNNSNSAGIYKYSNNTWSQLNQDFGDFYINNLLVNPDNSNIIFASFEADTTEGRLYRSTDGGETWKQLTEGISNTNHLGVMTIQADNTSTLYMAGQNNGGMEGMLYKSTDDGDSWSEFYTGKKQEFFYTLLFDGLVSGNDRGVYYLQSYGKVSLKNHNLSHQRKRLTIKLQDAATLDSLSHKTVELYKKVKGKSWRLIESAKTNKQGKQHFIVVAHKSDKLKVVWKPNKTDQAEYAKSTSEIITIKK